MVGCNWHKNSLLNITKKILLKAFDLGEDIEETQVAGSVQES